MVYVNIHAFTAFVHKCETCSASVKIATTARRVLVRWRLSNPLCSLCSLHCVTTPSYPPPLQPTALPSLFSPRKSPPLKTRPRMNMNLVILIGWRKLNTLYREAATPRARPLPLRKKGAQGSCHGTERLYVCTVLPSSVCDHPPLPPAYEMKFFLSISLHL